MSPLEILTDLFGSDPADLFGATIAKPEGMARLVIRTLAEHGFEIISSDH
jgi:hypothetical protein